VSSTLQSPIAVGCIAWILIMASASGGGGRPS